jgi:dihydrofolate synthase/folylpolyglutamate synthase
MTYTETLTYLYAQLPMFQRLGGAAYKANLDNTWALMAHLGNPHVRFRTIHVAGTNGKGSTSHSLAAVLQAAGLKVGLYTSPHLKEFTERIRLNGVEIEREFVVRFVSENQDFIEKVKPSFFELTVGMAFAYFAEKAAQNLLDIAIIEVGMGGRLDSTNVILPQISVITNISYDHQAYLGDTLPKIAAEKAGIIKPNVPVVISKKQPDCQQVFIEKAEQQGAAIYFAEDLWNLEVLENGNFSVYDKIEKSYFLSDFEFELKGNYQRDNILGIIATLKLWEKNNDPIPAQAWLEGLANITRLTGLKGRWQKLSDAPLTIADVGHNQDAFVWIAAQLSEICRKRAIKRQHLVLGAVNDKDLKMFEVLPKNANYYFCKPAVERGLAAEVLKEKMQVYGLEGAAYPSVRAAWQAAKAAATPEDLIFIGGSSFVVAEVV